MLSRLFYHELFKGKTQKRVGIHAPLRVALSFIEPQLDKLVANKQAHTSNQIRKTINKSVCDLLLLCICYKSNNDFALVFFFAN